MGLVRKMMNQQDVELMELDKVFTVKYLVSQSLSLFFSFSGIVLGKVSYLKYRNGIQVATHLTECVL